MPQLHHAFASPPQLPAQSGPTLAFGHPPPQPPERRRRLVTLLEHRTAQQRGITRPGFAPLRRKIPLLPKQPALGAAALRTPSSPWGQMFFPPPPTPAFIQPLVYRKIDHAESIALPEASCA